MDMRGTHIYTSAVDPKHPLHFMQNPTQTRRKIHFTPAQHYHTLHDTLPPVPDNSSVRTHIHTEFTRRALDSLPPWCPAACCLRDRAPLAVCATGATLVQPLHTSPLIHAQARTCCGQQFDTEHVLLHCPHTQQYWITHGIHSLKHLWTCPVEVSNFLLDSGFVQSLT